MYNRPKTWALTLALSLALCLAAWSDQVYIRNKPFKGTVQGTGAALKVDLQGLVTALGLSLTEVSGNWVVTAADEAASLPEGVTETGGVYYQGKAILQAPEGGATMVLLNETATALGATVKANPSMGTVDVYMVSKTAGSGGGGPVASTSGYRLINFWASW